MGDVWKTYLRKLRTDPLGAAGRAWRKLVVDPFKYRRGDGYDARRYWADRFGRHGTSLRGAGDEGLSEAENAAAYEKAAQILLARAAEAGVVWPSTRVLEIGCGTGFYTQVMQRAGVTNYTGVDITDALFAELRDRHPDYRFEVRDAGRDALGGGFGVVLMIDVIEHIVRDEDMDAAMANVAAALAPGGVFFVTPVFDKPKRLLYYVRSWSADEVKRRLPGLVELARCPYRDGDLLVLRKP